MIEVKNYIKQALKEYDPELDVREGSVLSDFLINPLSYILDPIYKDIENLKNRLGLTNINEMSEQELDSMASMFAITRRQGSKATGNVYFYFNSPISFYVKAGTQLITNSNLVFTVLNDFTITSSQMAEKLDSFSTYKVGPITVIAEKEGTDYNVYPGTIFTPINKLEVSPARISNDEAFTSGENKETNEELILRIEHSLYGRSLNSPNTIRNFIKTNVSSVKNVEIIGAGHPLMLRDKVYNVIDIAQFKKEDYRFVYSGESIPVYDKKHKAYTLNFIDTDTSEEVRVPSILEWKDEFSDDDYRNISLENDLNYVETNKKVLISESFNSYENNKSFISLMSSKGWGFNDCSNKNYELFYLDEISLNNGKLRLGKSLTEEEKKAIIQKQQLEEFKAKLEEILKSDSKDIYIKDSIKLIDSYLINTNNLSPLIHKEINQPNGIEIKLTMSTNDGTENGEIAYITVLRNKTVLAPHDGFGLAWRKQPDYLIRMKNNNYGTNTELKKRDLEKFAEEHIVNGVPLNGEDYLGENMLNHPEVWKYNVFLVDNNILQEEVWISAEQFLDQGLGKNQFLQASKVWIEPNIDYNFIIKIHEGWAFEAWIYKSTEQFNQNLHKALNRGITYPNYVPLAGSYKTITGENVNYSDFNFGIAVGQTQNYEWYVSNLEIKSFIETFASHLFKIDISNFENNKPLTVKYYGIGYDPNLEQNNSKVKLYALNVLNNQWDLLGQHTNPLPTVNQNFNLENLLIKTTIPNINLYKDYLGFINIAAIASNSGPGFTNNLNHVIRTYYISVDNGELNGVNLGNCVDIYVHDPDNIILGKSTFVINGNKITLTGSTLTNGFIQQIIDVLDYYTKIPYDRNSYVIKVNNIGTCYSHSPDIDIIFANNMDGARVEVVYKYWSNGNIIKSLILDSDDRYPVANYLVKVAPPAVVTIESLLYSGGLDLNDMKQKIKDYINSINDRKLEKSDLVNLLYDNGATFVNLNMDITIKEYNYDMSYEIKKLEGQKYELSENKICQFYTDFNELKGVEKI